MSSETRRQTIVGTVVSSKMDKTVVVQVETQKQHPHYKKFIRTRKNFKAHDEKNECELGDEVRCMETRPLSKDKRWRVTEIIRRHYTSEAEIVDPDVLVVKKQKPVHGEEHVAETQVEQPAEQPVESKAEAPAEETVAEEVANEEKESE